MDQLNDIYVYKSLLPKNKLKYLPGLPICNKNNNIMDSYQYNLSACLVTHPLGDKNNQSEERIREFIAFHLN